jgi:hypothetical protein
MSVSKLRTMMAGCAAWRLLFGAIDDPASLAASTAAIHVYGDETVPAEPFATIDGTEMTVLRNSVNGYICGGAAVIRIYVDLEVPPPTPPATTPVASTWSSERLACDALMFDLGRQLFQAGSEVGNLQLSSIVWAQPTKAPEESEERYWQLVAAVRWPSEL